MTSTIVVYVHGLWFTGLEGHWLRRRIADELAAEPRSFSYRSVTSGAADNVAALGKFLAQQRADQLHIVAHSLGGVLVVKLFDNPPPLPPGRVVLLAAPVNGSRAAQNLMRIPFGAAILGATVRDEVLPGRTRRWHGEREVGVIAGRSTRGLGRLVGALEEPNDGTILVAETQLAGAADQIVLPVGHSGMLFSVQAAQQAAAFLRSGKFDHRTRPSD
jgi:pimeloyl-ACP methyl ester carboxylesterase